MAANRETSARRPVAWVVIAGLLILGAWVFPPFHVVRLAPAATSRASKDLKRPGAFDPKAAAAQVWRDQIPAAVAKAADVNAVVALLAENPDLAKTRYGRAAEVGAADFIVHGRGRVTARDRSQLTVVLDGQPAGVVALRIGPVFGNTVRDGCGLDLNAFPGLAEFNALSAELNALVEHQVLPALRQKAQVGATVTFTGCAEAPDFAADPGEPALTIVPVQAEVR
ncbi:MAG TPA: DUF2291 family protein [Opitutaceae bacterium]|nr:DUF2291 family protein [Opitutaceae bacterium]